MWGISFNVIVRFNPLFLRNSLRFPHMQGGKSNSYEIRGVSLILHIKCGRSQNNPIYAKGAINLANFSSFLGCDFLFFSAAFVFFVIRIHQRKDNWSLVLLYKNYGLHVTKLFPNSILLCLERKIPSKLLASHYDLPRRQEIVPTTEIPTKREGGLENYCTLQDGYFNQNHGIKVISKLNIVSWPAEFWGTW